MTRSTAFLFKTLPVGFYGNIILVLPSPNNKEVITSLTSLDLFFFFFFLAQSLPLFSQYYHPSFWEGQDRSNSSSNLSQDHCHHIPWLCCPSYFYNSWSICKFLIFIHFLHILGIHHVLFCVPLCLFFFFVLVKTWMGIILWLPSFYFISSFHMIPMSTFNTSLTIQNIQNKYFFFVLAWLWPTEFSLVKQKLSKNWFRTSLIILLTSF